MRNFLSKKITLNQNDTIKNPFSFQSNAANVEPVVAAEWANFDQVPNQHQPTDAHQDLINEETTKSTVSVPPPFTNQNQLDKEESVELKEEDVPKISEATVAPTRKEDEAESKRVSEEKVQKVQKVPTIR